jgi:glutamine synthetase
MHPEKTHHEVAPNQHEITLRYCPALKMADNLITVKNVIHFFAQQFGYRAFFMPKPFRHENGSGMHINYSLYNTQTRENAFYEPSGRYLLSDTARSFIAGNLAIMREYAALFNSTINSYKRLVRGFEAPVFVSWGNKNRTAQIRIPEVSPQQGKAVRAELRSPDGMGNPYLMFAALYVSGMEGVRQRFTLPTEADENLYLLSAQERSDRGIEQLPTSLEEALSAMKSSIFLKETLGTHIFENYLAGKRDEVSEYLQAITDWELEKYGNA